MRIVTDKGIYAIPVDWNDRTIYSNGWTSPKLRKKMIEWGIAREHVYKYVLPPKEQTEAIILYPSPESNSPIEHPVAIFGNKELAKERIFGIDSSKVKFEPKKMFEGRQWLEKIMDAFKQAEEKGAYDPGRIKRYDAKILFITRDKDYWKGICIGKNTVYDDYIKSKQLKAYFDELRLTKELLTAETE